MIIFGNTIAMSCSIGFRLGGGGSSKECRKTDKNHPHWIYLNQKNEFQVDIIKGLQYYR